MSLAGLDFSLNSTGIALDNNNFYFNTTLKKLPLKVNHPKIFVDNIDGSSEDNHLRYYNNAKKIIKILLQFNVNKIGIEGYSYGYGTENPGRVFDIAEALGMLKFLLIENNIQIYVFPPKQIKKFFTGNGNASKVLMIERFLSKNKNSSINYLIEELKIQRYNSPINDLVDAAAILELLKSNL